MVRRVVGGIPQWFRFTDDTLLVLVWILPHRGVGMMEQPYERDGKWFHTDEIICDEFGPFDTKAEAKESLDDFCFWLDHGLTRKAAQDAHGI